MSDLNRRDVLKLGAVGAAGAVAGLGFPAVIRAQAKEVVMLGIWPFTGAFSDVGPILDRGMKMALEERGMKILGRPIKYITRDSATQAGASTRRVEEAVDGEGAKFVIGPWSSGVALAVSEVAKRKKVGVGEIAAKLMVAGRKHEEVIDALATRVNGQEATRLTKAYESSQKSKSRVMKLLTEVRD